MIATGVRIYNDDCRLLLADIEADVVITDPVWPTAPAGMFEGAEDPGGLLWEALDLRGLCDSEASERGCDSLKPTIYPIGHSSFT